MADTTDLKELRRAGVAHLRSASIEDPEVDADLLLAEVLQCDRLTLLRRGNVDVGTAVAERFQQMLDSRASGCPVSRILGRREFWSLNLTVADGVLDPRSDSETLIEAVTRRLPDKKAKLRFLDLGSGSGCLLLALLSEYGNASGLGIDILPAAVDIARGNATNLGLGSRARFEMGDWCDLHLDTQFDVVIANPPYVPTADIAGLAPEVRLHDPTLALDGGDDGLEAYRQLATSLADMLKTRGIAVLECGMGQAGAVSGILSAAGFHSIAVAKDLSGIERCLVAENPDVD
jgi:release factor glutamine methyltransferase